MRLNVFIIRWLRGNQNHDKLLTLNRYFPQSEENTRCTCGNALYCTLAADFNMYLNCNAIQFSLFSSAEVARSQTQMAVTNGLRPAIGLTDRLLTN